VTPVGGPPQPWPRRPALALAAFVALGLGLGAVAGVVWEAVVDLPTYRVAADGGASTSERGLAAFVAGDAWYCVLGAGGGLLLGLLAWRWFARLGWPVVLVGTLTATAAGVLCWAVGTRLGPGDFPTRLAAAAPDSLVPIALELRAKVSLLVWPFLAVLPILLASSLGTDEEEPERAAPPAAPAASASTSVPEGT
jgi:hypothetical protein